MFDTTTGTKSTSSLIPKGTIAPVFFAIKETKNSKSSGGLYLNCEITITGGDFKGRKIFTMIPDPYDQRNSEKWREMGKVALVRLAEAKGLFTTANPESYRQFNGCADVMPMAQQIQGAATVIRIGVEKGQDGHEDKNTVSEWGTPRPDSDGNKIWKAWHEPKAQQNTFGASQPTAGVPAVSPAFASVPAQAPLPNPSVPQQTTPSWLKS